MMARQINYWLLMPKPFTHYFEVQIEVPGPFNESSLRVAMPVWTPGSYLVREFSRNVMGFKVTDAQGEPLKWNKLSKNVWEVAAVSSGIRISYGVYAFEYSDQTSYLDSNHAIVNGASVFMYVEGAQEEKHVLRIHPNPEWKVVSTGLDRISDGFEFIATSYDVLVDSPIEIGNQKMESFEVEGVAHEVSLFGHSTIDDAALVSDLKKIVQSAWPVFGTIPYKRYLFLIDFVAGPKGGGLEHLNSTHCIVPRMRLLPPEEYREMLGLFSHEYFHTWNVKRMRPKGLGPFDYTKETYTKSLWIAEGITSYYDDLILRRAGIYSVPEYLDAFSTNINYMISIPSSRFESAEQASFDTWIKFYRPDENTPNAQSSYYIQGATIGWMLDMEIRKATRNKKNLDHVMRKVYNETYVSRGEGYDDAQFEEACNFVAGKDLSFIFDSRVRGREEVDFNRFLSYSGLRIGPKMKNLKQKGYMGIKLRSNEGRTYIDSKLFESPADIAGLAAKDEIVAIDNLRMDGSLINHYISNKRSGESINVLVSRDGHMESHDLVLGLAPVLEHRIYKFESASKEQKDFFQSWLISEWDIPFEYSDYTPSPQKPRLFDFI